MDKQNLVTIFILGIIFLSIVAIVYYFSSKENDIKEQTEFVELVALEDESLYLSVSEGINYLFTTINDNDADITIDLLNEKYIEKNNINEFNVIEKFEKYKYSSFKASTVYVISNKENYAFLVEGLVVNNAFEELPTIKETEYFIVYYDIITSHYNIMPITKETYNKYNKNKNLKTEEVISNDNNILTLGVYDNETLSAYYFNDIISNMYSNPEYIYDKISYNTKNKYFKTYEEFIDFISKDNFFGDVYLIKYNKNNKVYKLIDNKNTTYDIAVENGLNYKVDISLYEEENNPNNDETNN